MSNEADTRRRRDGVEFKVGDRVRIKGREHLPDGLGDIKRFIDSLGLYYARLEMVNGTEEEWKIDYLNHETEIGQIDNHVSSTVDPWQNQVGGNHYSKLKIQPMQYALANSLDFAQATAIKYITRFRDKGGIADLEKAKHTIDLLIAHEQGKTNVQE